MVEGDKRGAKLIDLTGMRFGSYEIIERVKRPNYKGTLWLCRCTICGREALKGSHNIRNGEVRNCECQRKTYVPAISLGRIPYEFCTKYGCYFCSDRKACTEKFRAGGELVCKYAEDIDECGSFDKYLETKAFDANLRELLEH